MNNDIFASENDFYLRCDPSRISKFLAHAKLFERSLGIPGDFAEVGVFRGASFSRFRKLGRLFQPDHARKFLGFDIFGDFPKPQFDPDKPILDEQFKNDGSRGIDRDSLLSLLESQGLAANVELIAGNVLETLPAYLESHQQLTFSIVNIDVDLYEATKVAIECLFPRVARGGVIILDDYEGFPGAKHAVDAYLQERNRPEKIEKYPFALSPCFLIKH
jgi:hypothetical protein